MGDQDELKSQLDVFIGEYEQANNRHDIARVVQFIADDAVYWFSNGSFRGLPSVKSAIEQTFATSLNEVYEVQDLEWPVVTTDLAVCRYQFAWRGEVAGQSRSGRGRGTNVIVMRDGRWQIVHEHLSS
ncbi:YybH family protein [Streptomyces sp. NPDC060085]|uniref:YybH family protein n=1 Tax=Streptomyces sp. NPDC060085 TaxID=3347054 RepID=UPI00366176C4